MSWASEELSGTKLGDERRKQRLIRMVEDLASSPESSVPLASRDAAALQGAYDFWSNPRVKAEGILSGHVQSTVERCDHRKVVLAIQDTTELNYSGHRSKRGLGYLRGEETRGALLHSVLAASTDGVPLGILHQRMWARQGRKTKQRRRKIEEKESGRWLEGMKRSEELLGEGTRVITVADREADIYELLSRERRVNSEYLIRNRQNRQVREDPAGPSESLYRVLKKTPTGDLLKLSLKRNPRRAARDVLLRVRWIEVWLQPPGDHPERAGLAPVRVSVLSAEEIVWDLGEDEPPIDWILVTTLPIESIEDAQQLLLWYSYRWLIERYHFVLKSGCQVETLQLETFDRLERAVATYAIVAWRLIELLGYKLKKL